MTNKAGCVLGIDAGGTFLKASLVRADRSFVSESVIRRRAYSEGSASEIRDAFRSLCTAAAAQAAEAGEDIKGIDICVPGPFDYQAGTSLMKHKYRAVYGISMRPWFREILGGIPLCFLHDSHAFLLGALWQEKETFLRAAGVTIGTGLGFASWKNGSLLKNDAGGPEISIFSRPYRQGISEDYVSRRAVIRNFYEYGGNDSRIDAAEIAGLALQGNSAAVKAFQQLGDDLARIVHDILVENRFEALFLGGAISKSYFLFQKSLCEYLHDVPSLKRIAPAYDIDTAPILGAVRAVCAVEQKTSQVSGLFT